MTPSLFSPLLCAPVTPSDPLGLVCAQRLDVVERALAAKRNVKDGPHPGLEIHKATYLLGPHASEGSVGLSAKPTDLI